MSNGNFSKEQELMLEEYKQLQNSAQHNDTTSWTMSSLFVLSTITILANIFDIMRLHPILVLLIASTGILLLGINFISFRNAQEMKKWKYEKCKNIEEYFNQYYKNRFDNCKLQISDYNTKKYKFSNHSQTSNMFAIRRVYQLIMLFIAMVFVFILLYNSEKIINNLNKYFLIFIISFGLCLVLALVIGRLYSYFIKKKWVRILQIFLAITGLGLIYSTPQTFKQVSTFFIVSVVMLVILLPYIFPKEGKEKKDQGGC
jgi:hypothetical protein